jgi:hypothetical protein
VKRECLILAVFGMSVAACVLGAISAEATP